MITRTILVLTAALSISGLALAGPVRHSNIRVYTEVACGVPVGPAHDIDLTGRQFATLEEVRAFLANALRDVFEGGAPFAVTFDDRVPDALSLSHGIDEFAIGVSDDPASVWPELGFPVDAPSRFGFIDGLPLDLDRLNERLRSQLAEPTGVDGARHRGHDFIDA